MRSVGQLGYGSTYVGVFQQFTTFRVTTEQEEFCQYHPVITDSKGPSIKDVRKKFTKN